MKIIPAAATPSASRFRPDAYLGLIRNGSGLLGDNDNFKNFEYVTSDVAAGAGSFLCRGAGIHVTDELVPADPSRIFRIRMNVKHRAGPAGAIFTGLVAYDIDGKDIRADMWMHEPSTMTTLTQTLNTGDTVAHVASTANWYNGAAEHLRGFMPFNYRNGKGFVYPPGTYSRNTHMPLGGLYAEGALTATTVPLREPWARASVPAGTPVANGAAGATFTYIGAVAVAPNGNWQTFEGLSTGLCTTGMPQQGGLLPPGTAYVKPLILATYGATEQTELLVNMVSLEVVS